MTMQSVFFKENRGSVHVQTRWAGLCSRTMMQPMANHDGGEAFPKLITSLELSANYAKAFNAAADAVKEREVHTNKQTLDHNKGNNYTTHDLFTLLSDYEAGVREDAQNGQQTTQVHDRQGHFEFGFGRPTVCAKKYPYAEACYRVYSTYGNQIAQGRIVLPLNTTTGGDGAMPIYVNAKQYNGIMRRRRKRQQLMASEKKVLESRKPYMHLSRHLHAMRRPRGSGGRFLNAKDSENSKKESKTDDPIIKEAEHNKHNNLPLYNSSTGSSQVSDVLLRSTTKSSGGERSYSPNPEVNSHHHMLSFDMNDHLHHHAPPSFGAFPDTNGLGFNVMAASDAGTCVMGNSFLAKSSLSPAFGDN